MPDYSLLTEALGRQFDPEHSGSRFDRRLAVGLSAPEGSGGQIEEWLLEPDDALGTPRVFDGSVGRGASGVIPVVEWAAEAISGGIIDLIIAAAVTKLIRRLRRSRKDATDRPSDHPRFYISRGLAAAIAAEDVVASFEEEGPLEVEAVEEPSSIAGVPTQETGYVGIEPWLVLLRNAESQRRYYVVVSPDGEVLGRIETDFMPYEKLYMQPGSFEDDQ
jgi:hypothetical protein